MAFLSCNGGAKAGEKAGFRVMLKYFEIKKPFRYYIKQIDNEPTNWQQLLCAFEFCENDLDKVLYD